MYKEWTGFQITGSHAGYASNVIWGEGRGRSVGRRWKAEEQEGGLE